MQHKYLNCDFYWVNKKSDGQTIIHPYGFGTDIIEPFREGNPDKRFMFLYYDYVEFIPDDIAEDIDDYYGVVGRYGKNFEFIHEDELLHMLDSGIFNPPVELPISLVSDDTPEGWYVDYNATAGCPPFEIIYK